MEFIVDTLLTSNTHITTYAGLISVRVVLIL